MSKRRQPFRKRTQSFNKHTRPFSKRRQPLRTHLRRAGVVPRNDRRALVLAVQRLVLQYRPVVRQQQRRGVVIAAAVCGKLWREAHRRRRQPALALLGRTQPRKLPRVVGHGVSGSLL